MAVALAVPIVEAAIANAPTILAAGTMAMELAEKYGPKVKGAVNHLFRLSRKKKSAKAWLRGLGTRKGLKQFITKDLGKVMKGAGRLVNEATNMTDDFKGLAATGVGGEKMKHLASMAGKGAMHANRYYETAEKYHTAGSKLASPLKAYRF